MLLYEMGQIFMSMESFLHRGISPRYEMSIPKFQKNLIPLPIVHELLKRQSTCFHHGPI